MVAVILCYQFYPFLSRTIEMVKCFNYNDYNNYTATTIMQCVYLKNQDSLKVVKVEGVYINIHVHMYSVHVCVINQ